METSVAMYADDNRGTSICKDTYLLQLPAVCFTHRIDISGAQLGLDMSQRGGNRLSRTGTTKVSKDLTILEPKTS